VASRWKWSEVVTCNVLKAAYERGYGTPDEIMPVNDQSRDRWSFDVSHYLNQWKSPHRPKNSD